MTERLTSYDREGLVFAVTDTGPLDGAPVVLLHGFPQRATSWRMVAPLLHEAGLRTVAPDQRGYSPGARPRRRRDYRIQEVVADVVALVDRIGRPVHLVGHDWGAAAAWYVAALHPDLVRSLVAVSVPHPAAMMQALWRSDQARRSWYMGMFQLPLLPEHALAGPRGVRMMRGSGMTHEMVARYQREIVADGALPGGLGWYRGIPFADPRLLRTPVTVPTTHIWSDGDVALGRTGAELTERFVRADYRLEVLPGVSHWIPEEAPGRLAEIIVDRVRAA